MHKPFDVITARALSSLGRMVALFARFSTSDTVWVLPKGASARQELTDLPKKHQEMFHVEQSLTHANAGVVIGHGKLEKSR